MLNFLNTIIFRSTSHKSGKQKIPFSSLRLIKNGVKTTSLLKLGPFFKEKEDIGLTEQKKKDLYLVENDYFLSFNNSFLCNSSNNTCWNLCKSVKQENIGYWNETSFMIKPFNTFSKWTELKTIPVLSFSWLKTIRKKQYYNIIGKIGIKKRNAGMYWDFYVAKRKKIKKKRKTI